MDGLTYLLVTGGAAIFLDLIPATLVSPFWFLLNAGATPKHPGSFTPYILVCCWGGVLYHLGQMYRESSDGDTVPAAAEVDDNKARQSMQSSDMHSSTRP
jgi:hypothetical protein